MAKQIEGVSERILQCAKEEFLKKRVQGCFPAGDRCGGGNQYQLHLCAVSG